MQVKALKTFRNKEHGTEPDGLVRTGLVITVPDNIAGQWIRTGLATKWVAPDRAPDRVAALSGPDHTKGGDSDESDSDDEDEDEDNVDEEDESEDDETEAEGDECQSQNSAEGQQAGGEETQSSSRRRARPSSKKTSKRSKAKRS